MEEKTQGEVGELPNTPSNLQEALQAPPKCFYIVQNEECSKPSRETRLKTHFLTCQWATAQPCLSSGQRQILRTEWRSAPLSTAQPFGAQP